MELLVIVGWMKFFVWGQFLFIWGLFIWDSKCQIFWGHASIYLGANIYLGLTLIRSHLFYLTDVSNPQ